MSGVGLLVASAALSCGVQGSGGMTPSSGSVAVVVVVNDGGGGSGASTGGTPGGGTGTGASSAGSVTSSGTGASSGAANSGTAASGAASTGTGSSGMATSGVASTGSASSGVASTGGPSCPPLPLCTSTTTCGMSDLCGLPSSGACNGTSDAGTSPSGLSIVINGVQVPKEKAIAFIHIGHSNMAGRGDAPATLRPYFFMQPDPHGWMFHTKNGFQPADEPLTAGDPGNYTDEIPGQTLPLGGPGTAIIKESIALAPDDYFISLGYGVGTAYCSEFLPGALYYNDLMAAPLALKGKVTFGAIFVMLGITERHGTADDITGYPACINKLVTAIRTDLGEPNLPLLLTDYEMEATDLPPTAAFGMAIIPQIRLVPSVVCNSALVPTSGLVMLPGMEHHFDLPGHQVWVQRALAMMQQRGWFPWQ